MSSSDEKKTSAKLPPVGSPSAATLAALIPEDPAFRASDAVRPMLRTACADHPRATWHELGTSEEGRPIHAAVLGNGPFTVSLIAGNHADEPVGPETLRTLIERGLQEGSPLTPWLDRVQFVVVPHANPDGEARNRPWVANWPSLEAYLQHVEREPPGRDLEFGFPDMRKENRIVATFLEQHSPIALHMSLHGMAVSEGAMLLINRPWTFRTQPLRDGFREAARATGLRMHDHNRKGEKGFFYIEPGFTTTPRGDAMRTFFQAQGDETMATRFRQSSMEFVMGLGGDPLCLVTELPLFVIYNHEPTPGVPERYLALKSQFVEAKQRLAQGQPIDDLIAPFDMEPLPLPTAMQLQLHALELGLRTVTGGLG